MNDNEKKRIKKFLTLIGMCTIIVFNIQKYVAFRSLNNNEELEQIRGQPSYK